MKKEKPCDYLNRCVKSIWQIQVSFMLKTLSKLGIKANFFNPIKGTYDQPAEREKISRQEDKKSFWWQQQVAVGNMKKAAAATKKEEEEVNRTVITIERNG